MATSIHSPRCRPARLIGARVIMLVCAAHLACGDLAQAEIVYSGTQNIAIPTDFNGVFIDVFSLQHSTTEFGGWDLNPFFGGLGIANSPDFQPVRIGTGNEDSIAPITFGSIINGSALFSSDYGMSGAEDDSGHLGPFAGQIGTGQTGYLGFKLLRGTAVNYGWMRVNLTRNEATGAILDWAYDDSGSSILTGAVADLGAAPVIYQAGSDQTLNASEGGSGLLMEAGAKVTFNDGAQGATYTGKIHGAGELKVAGAGGLRLAGSNTFSGTASVLEGSRLTVGEACNLGSAQVRIGSAASVVFDSLAANNGSANTFANAISLDGQAATLNNSGNGKVVLAGAIASNSGLLGFSGGSFDVIGDITGAGSLRKEGSGTLTLTGANTYSGGTALTAGSVSISAANNLGTGTITFSNSARLIFEADGINLTQSIANSSASQYQVAADNTATLSGQISGFGQLQKFGAGTLILDNANSYSGKTVINGGTLKLGSSGSINATNVDVLGGTFDLNGKTQSVTDTLVLGSASGSGSISGGGTINVGNTFSLVQGSISSTMAGTGSVSKTGSTTVTLAGSNSYTGATNVTAGKLILNGSTSASSAVGVSSGASLAGSGTVGGNTTIASGGALAPGNSPGVLTVAGTTTLDSGSMFEWEIDTAQSNPETNRGVAYDGLNTTALAGSGAFFKVMLTGTQDFTDNFWNQNRTWTDIFKSADGSSILSSWASVFSGGFQYSYNGQTVAPTSQGFFTATGSSLTWSAVPEPSNLLAGLLAASVLLRRRRIL